MSRTGRRDGRGQALVELALVLPILVTLLLGTIDVGRILFAYIGLEEAVQEGASYGAAMAPTDAATRCTQVQQRVTTSSTQPEVTGATVACPGGVICTPGGGDAAKVTVVATFALPLITPVGSTLFGGSYTLRAEVKATSPYSACTP